jgi:short-subunit dehydrogenase
MKHIAVITGASSGMGKEFALTLKDHGVYDEVWAIARSAENLEHLRPLIPFNLKVLPLDLTKPESLDVYKEELEKEKPHIGLLINASGFGIFDSLERSRMEDTEGMIDLNCKALVKMTKLSLPYMSAGSKIIQIASMAAFQPIPYINVYGASKAFVLSFSRALNREVEKKGIHCMAVCPYWTRTKFFERAIDPDKQVVKKYIVMYEPENIVKRAWKDLARGKDVSIYGVIARGQAALCKILPHKLVMDIWQKQQDL